MHSWKSHHFLNACFTFPVYKWHTYVLFLCCCRWHWQAAAVTLHDCWRGNVSEGDDRAYGASLCVHTCQSPWGKVEVFECFAIPLLQLAQWHIPSAWLSPQLPTSVSGKRHRNATCWVAHFIHVEKRKPSRQIHSGCLEVFVVKGET